MKKDIILVAIIVGLILLVPLYGYLFVEGWNWQWHTFVLAGALLFGAGMTYVLVARKMRSRAYRLAVGLAVATALVLTWVNLAVGIIGDFDDTPVNLFYFAIVGIGFASAAIAHFKPRGMAWILFAMAIAQMAVPLAALVFWPSQLFPGVAKVFVLNAVFAMLFAGSALLFRRAAQQRKFA